MSDRLNISLDRGSAQITIALAGELDVSSAAELHMTVEREIGEGHSRLTLNLADLTFIDSGGLSALVTAYDHCQSAGGAMTLRSPSRQVAKVLQITGLDALFTIQTDE